MDGSRQEDGQREGGEKADRQHDGHVDGRVQRGKVKE